MIKIVKRDGRKQAFNSKKILEAIQKASLEVLEGGLLHEELHVLSNRVHDKVLQSKKELIEIQELQSIIENVLMASKYKEVARSYIQYRHDRDVIREKKGQLLTDVQEFINQSNKDLTNENANKDAKNVSTHRDLLAGILSKNIAHTQVLTPELSKWHKDGYGHIHDLDYIISPLTNCCLVNYADMLEKGFHVGNAHIGKPKSIGVACTVISQVILGVSSVQYGGQTIAHIDRELEQYVQASYDKLVEKQKKYNLPDSYVEEEISKEVYDAMQTLLYQCNSLSSSNGQTPFITLSLGLSTSKFGRMITENYLKVHKQGLGEEHITPVFPKVVFFLEDGVNMKEGDPNYDLKVLAMETAIKRIYPDFVSVPLNKKVTGSSTGDVTSMGCRSFLSKWEDENGNEKYSGRFNLGVVSISLPMIALEAKDEVHFFELLDHHMEMALKAHLLRVERLKDVKASTNPIMFMEGALSRLGADEAIGKLFYDGYASISIGYVGVAEMCQVLHGSLDKDFAMEVLNYMKSKCEEYKKETGLAFSLYGTPAENLAYRFAKCINDKYPNVLHREYLTNSFHFPVWEETNPFEKWDYETGFAYISNGGNIGYVETPNMKHNMKGFEALINYAYEHIPYFGINQPVDQCFKCGFNGEFEVDKDGFCCPECGNRDSDTISVIRRVSGYLSAPNSRPFNKGKQEEVIQRIKHQK